VLIPPLKLTAKAPENRGPLGKGDYYQKPPFLGGYVSFRECRSLFFFDLDAV